MLVLAPGTVLNGGTYRVERLLTSTHGHEVHLANETPIGRHVAVKVSRVGTASPAAEISWLREQARLTALLDHPHVVPIYYLGHERVADFEVTYVVMQYAARGSLVDVLRSHVRDRAETAAAYAETHVPRPLWWRGLGEPLRWLQEVAEALAYAHSCGVMHSDLKPDNILMTERDVVKVADFGVGSVVQRHVYAKGETTPIGTLGSTSPERIRGEAEGPPSDIYSLGVTCYEIFTGQRPYDGYDDASVMSQHLDAPIPSARAANRHLPLITDRLIQRMMAKRPTDRPSAREVAQVLASARLHASPKPI